MKRSSPPSFDEAERIKRLCCSSSHDTDNNNCVQVDKHKPLELLPVELLLLILDLSAEPALIHTSRQLYYSLPQYTAFSKALAWTALSPTALKAKSGQRKSCTDSSCDGERQRIRTAVFGSPWFGDTHLRHIHQKLLQDTIAKACEYSERGPSRGQRKRIRSFTERPTQFLPIAQLNLRLRDGRGRPLNLNSTPLHVNLTAQHTTSALRPLIWPVLDFGRIVPDYLLRHPFNTGNLKLLSHIADSATRGFRIPEAVTCDRELLSEAFHKSITTDDATAFFTFCSVESLLDQSANHGILDRAHVEAAVRHGQPRMLIAVLKRMWTYGKESRPCDGHLIELINKARAFAWPEWPKTTRICAMETASIWKTKQVEESGGQVSHIFHAWPPELKICLPYHRAQTWFIPKDFRYDVDWETSCSAMNTWRPNGPYKDISHQVPSAFAFFWDSMT